MTPQIVSERMKGIIPSNIRQLLDLAQGIPGIISLGIGEPDFVTPAHIRESAKLALDEGQTALRPLPGDPCLGVEVANRYERDFGVQIDPTRHFFDYNGGIQACFYAGFATINPGDDVLVPNPGFLCYPNIVLAVGGNPIPYPCPEENGFKPELAGLEAAITPAD